MKNLYFYLIVATVLFSSQACHRNIYVPNTQNVTLFQDKGDTQVNVGYSNLQVAHAIGNNIGLMLNSQYTLGDKTSPSYGNALFEDTPSKRNIIEIGAGYFDTVNDKGFNFEIYGGAGIGEIEFQPRPENAQDYFYAKNSRFFIQPAFGFSKTIVDLAFSMRFSHLNYFNSATSNYQYNPEASASEQDLNNLENSSYSFVEPAITFRVGWKYVKFHTQIVVPYQIGGRNINHQGNINVGIHVNLAKRYKN